MPAFSTLVDHFTGDAINPFIWNYTALPVVTGGALVIPVISTYTHIYTDLDTYSLSGDNCRAQFLLPGRGNNTKQVFMYVEPNAFASGNSLRFQWDASADTITMFKSDGGVNTTVATVAYNATTMSWWRIREAAGTIYYDTAPADQSTWTNRGTTTPPAWDITTCNLRMSAGYYGTETASDVLVYSVNGFNETLLSPSSITSAETFGSHYVGVKPVFPTSITSGEAFGTAKITQIAAPPSINSGEAFGTSLITQPLSSIIDNFNDGVINNPPWVDVAGAVATGGVVTITCAGAYNHIETDMVYRLTNSYAYVESVGLPEIGNGSTQAILQIICGNFDDRVEIIAETQAGDWVIVCRHVVGGVQTDDFTPYNAIDHRWWQIREENDDLYWEVSPDGITWTTLRTEITDINTDVVYVALVSGHYAAETTPGTAIFDNFNASAIPNISPSGIASSEVFGTATVTNIVAPSSIASGEIFGTSKIINDIKPSSIISQEVFGTATITRGPVNIAPTGISSGEAIGTAQINRGAVSIVPSGITTGEAFGTAALNTGAATLAPTGIASQENFGTPKINLVINVSSINSSESFGSGVVAPGPVNVAPSSILSSESLGSPIISQGETIIQITGISSGEAFGSATVTRLLSTIAPPSITSVEVFGSANITQIINPSSISSQENFGVVSFGLFITPPGITTSESVGTPNIIYVVTPSGIVTQESVSVPTIGAAGVSIAPSSILSTETFGLAIVSQGEIIVQPPGLDSEEAFGLPQINMNINVPSINSEETFGASIVQASGSYIFPSSIISNENFGNQIITVGSVFIETPSINSEEELGHPLVTTGELIVEIVSIVSEEEFGTPHVSVGPVVIQPLSINSEEEFGYINVIRLLQVIEPISIKTNEFFGNFVVYTKFGNGAEHDIFDELMPHIVYVTRGGVRNNYGKYITEGVKFGPFKCLVEDVRSLVKDDRGETISTSTTAYINTDGMQLEPNDVIELPAQFGGANRRIASINNWSDEEGLHSVEVRFQ